MGLVCVGAFSGLAYAASITAPDVPRFGDAGSDNVITSAERSSFQIIFNFTDDAALNVGDRIYLLNGTDALAANFTTPIFRTGTQAEINQNSINFTNTDDLSDLGDGNYILRGQWVDVDGGGQAGAQGNEASTLTLDSDTTPTVTITSNPSSPSGTKTSLTFNFEFS
ncbi:hypothetical protein AAA799P11_00047 [Marine Group I thaumarchaeote SCGC AAA799-P11]|uniref:Uncharacterized protein n=1 Tax=Marine Group I thaumarchaeote SCGC AAA799-P11 TaxID=1502295 RepID=A0A087S3J6_9ARCH|nr:hypothetical protein AAA799P11_00047 [Marine Group I thaumarchaeote SCGC AAA799-P11]